MELPMEGPPQFRDDEQGIQARHLWNMKRTLGWEVFEKYLRKEIESAERQIMKPEISKGTREFFAGELFFGKKKVLMWLDSVIEIGKQS
jgi:hypothetical protein